MQFRAKGGQYVAGTFIRMKRKNAEVHSLYDQYGLKHANTLRWNVPSSGLIPLTPDQIKNFEFP